MAIGSTAAQLFVRVGADTTEAEAGLLGLSGTLTSFGASLAQTGGLMTAGLTVPLAMVAKAAIGTAIDYQSSMNMFQAVTGASSDEMAKAGDLAKQLGADMTLPATSAGDAAVAMTELAKGGLSVQDALDGARGVLQMSAAGNISNAEAATIAANALNTFGLKGTEATRIADLLAAAANASSSEMGDLAYGLQAGGAVFAAAGVPIEQFVAMLAEMSNAGIKSQDAGTSLKSMLLALEHPTKKARELMGDLGISIYDSSGAMRPFRDIIGNLQSSMGSLAQQQRDQAMATLFGSDGIRAATVLMRDGVDGFDKMSVAVGKQGAAADLAGARMQGLGGAFQGLQSVVETAMLNAVQPFMDTMEGLVRRAAELAGGLGTLDPNLRNAAFAFAGVLAAAGPFLLGMAGLATVVAFVLTPIGALVLGIASLAAWLASSPERLEAFRVAAESAFAWLKDNVWTPFLASAQTALGWLQTTGLPAIESAAGTAFEWLSGTAWPTMQAAAQGALGWLSGTALPAIESAASTAFAWAKDSAWPAMQAAASSVLTWLSGTALPAIGSAATTAFAWAKESAWPAMQAAAQGVLGWLSGTALPAIQGAAGTAFAWLRDTGWPTFSTTAYTALAWLHDTALPLIQTAAGTAFTWVRDTAWPQLKTDAQIALGWLKDTALPAVETAAGKAFTWVKDTAWPQLQAAAQGPLGWLKDTALPAIETAAGTAFQWVRDTAWPQLKTDAQTALSWIGLTGLPTLETALAQAKTTVGLLGLGFSELGSGNVTTGLYALGKAVGIDLLPAMQTLQPVVALLKPHVEALANSAAQLALTLAAQLKPILDALGPLLRELAPIIGTVLAVAVDGLLIKAREMADVWRAFIPVAGVAVVEALHKLTDALHYVNTVVGDLSKIVTSLSHGDWTAAWTAMKQTAVDALAALPAAIGVLLGPGMVQTGKDLVNGIIQGIQGGLPSMTAAVEGLAQSAVNAAKQALGIASPSTEFAVLGAQSAEGFQVGFDNAANGLGDHVSNTLANEIAAASAGMVKLEDGSWVPPSFFAGYMPADGHNPLAHAGMLKAEDGSWVPPSFYASDTRRALGPPATTINNYGHTINAPLITNPTVRNDQDLDQIQSAIFDAFDKGESGALSTRGHSGGASGGSGGGLGLPSPPIHFTVPA